MNEEKRRHGRISTQISVDFVEVHVDDTTQQHLLGVAKDCGLGGMFIATEHPFQKESILELYFTPDGNFENSQPLQARAVVRWVQTLVQPKGIGVQFVEIQGMESLEFIAWLENLSD